MHDRPAPACSADHLSFDRLSVAVRLQEIEGNPLSAEEVAMFQMFEREGWSEQRRRAYILAKQE